VREASLRKLDGRQAGPADETLQPSASVARVARGHGVNTNHVSCWQQLYRQRGLRARHNQMFPPRFWQTKPTLQIQGLAVAESGGLLPGSAALRRAVLALMASFLSISRHDAPDALRTAI